MDKKDNEEVKSKLLEINQLILQIDPSIRASAFEILAPYYFAHRPSPPPRRGTDSPLAGTPSTGLASDTSDLEKFISGFDNKQPADNVTLLVAWLYSNHGLYPVTAKEVKELGHSCGLIVPARPDNTMRQLKKNGKTLFNQQGKGWQPTVSGEMFLKKTYKIKKGNNPIPKE